MNGGARPVSEKLLRETGEGWRVAASRCQACGRTYFPAKRLCTSCLEDTRMQEVFLSRAGVLRTYSISHLSTSGLPTPYAFGLVDLPEGVRIFALLEAGEPLEENLRLDMEVEMCFGPVGMDEAGQEVWGYKFKAKEG